MEMKNNRKHRAHTSRDVIEQIYRLHCEDGISVKQLSIDFNKPYKTVEGIITRENKRKRTAQSEQLKPKGRPPADNSELARLRMENELLRDFLHAIGKR